MITTFVTEMNSENFQDKINQTEKSIVYIKASWCGPCKQLSPTIDEVSSELGTSVTICKMDADENMDFVKSLNVRNIPTLLFYKNGEVVERSVGVKSKSEILKLVESL
jgi:thioredoxin 1